MPYLLFLLTLPVMASVRSQWTRHGEIESQHSPSYTVQATGNTRRITGPYSWPFKPLSIGHTNASYQNYGSDPYFHHGIDIRGDAGTPVKACAGGKVIRIENYIPGDPAYWEIAIQDADGYIWQYHHVLRSSMPQSLFRALSSGVSIPAGAQLGTIYPWPISTFGERYHHVHLNILAAGGVYLNPMLFLDPLPDVQPPVIREVALFQNGRKLASRSVSGTYSLIAHIEDKILGNNFILPPYAVWIQVDDTDSWPVWIFNELPGGNSRTAYVDNFYVKGLACGDYRCRRPIINLGFSLDRNPFPTSKGPHRVEVTAYDLRWNSDSTTFTYQVE